MALISVALLFDALQLLATFFHVLNAAQVIPILGQVIGFVGSALAFILPWVIGVVAQMFFWMWFAAVVGADGSPGAKAFAMRFLIYMSVFVAELVPIINSLPAITFGVVALIVVTNMEHAAGKKVGAMGLSQARRGIRG